MAQPGVFDIKPAKINIKGRLYMLQMWNAPNNTTQAYQQYVARPGNPNNFGETIVYEWPIYDRLDDPKKLIAKAGGSNVVCNMGREIRQNCLSIVFGKDSGFENSTLQVLGTFIHDKGSAIPDGDSWSIAGGTGKFNKAEGTMTMKTVKQLNGGKFLEVTIDATCIPKN